MLGFGGSTPPLSTKTLNKQYKGMENKETINENSFLARVKAFAQLISDDVTKHQYDENKHRALVVLASDAEDESTKSHLVACGDPEYIIRLLNKLISSYPLSSQKALIDLLRSCYEQRKNGK